MQRMNPKGREVPTNDESLHQPNIISESTESNSNRHNANNTRMATRASATDFFVPRVQGQGANTFFFTAIKEWNSLSTDLKNENVEDSFKNKLKRELFEVAKKREEDNFI